jgi:hypothetical protein
MQARILVSLFLAVALHAQEGDQGPPRLKRGKPATAAEPKSGPPSSAPPLREIVTDADGNVVQQTGTGGAKEPSLPRAGAEAAAPEAPPPVNVSAPAESPIALARRVSAEYAEKVPNFICDQVTLRYLGEGWPKPTWKLKDRVTAEIMYSEGQESYRNVKVGGKLLGLGKKKPPEESGSWSTGDWMSVPLDVIQPSTDASFKYDREDIIGGRPAHRYTYAVRKSNSHWKVQVPGYDIKPAYRGAVWIDKETNRVTRVEMEARELPQDYPLSVVEMTVELGPINIRGQTHLMPVKSQNLSCQRDSVSCSRNDVEFRNYKMFSAESTISTTDSTITFDGAEDPPKPAAAPVPAKKKKK